MIPVVRSALLLTFLLGVASGELKIRVGIVDPVTKPPPPPTQPELIAGVSAILEDLSDVRQSPDVLARKVNRLLKAAGNMSSQSGFPRGSRTNELSATTTPAPPRKYVNIFNKWLNQLNNSEYDKYFIPKENKRPVLVSVSMMLIRLHSVSDANMDFGIELYYREQWKDYRLRFEPKHYDDMTELNLPIGVMDYVWKPDTYFLNAISAVADDENSVTHKAFFRLNSSGHIHYSRKISIKADCTMDLLLYPFDQQACKLKLGSYSHKINDLTYEWMRDQHHGLEVQDSVKLPEFTISREDYRTYHKELTYTTGKFDSLELCIIFHRSAGFCIFQIFFPATAVVMSSWVALWMTEDTTFSDVLAVILAIIFLAYQTNNNMPRVSYMKLLDLYMCACFMFVFLSLAKLVIIKYLLKRWAKHNNRSVDWFFDHMAGMTLASELEAENNQKGEDQKQKPGSDSNHQSNGPLLPKKARRAEPEIRSKNSVDMYDTASDAEAEDADDEDASSEIRVKERKGLHAFIVVPEKPQSGSETPTSDDKKENAKAAFAKRASFFGVDAFAAWFDEKRRKKSGTDRYLKYLKGFHIITQLALPIAFGVFFVFLLLIYPNVPRADICLSKN